MRSHSSSNRWLKEECFLGEYAAEVCLRPGLGQVTRHESVDRFMSLFLPGNIVALAFASPAL